MGRRAKPAVQRYHDRVAGRYDDIYDDAYWQWHDALTWDHLKPYLPRSNQAPLLDLGCGTGKWALRLAKSGFRVTCVDISPAMLDQARRKFDEMGLSAKAEFVQADLMDLSALPEEAYAGALAMGDPIGCTETPPTALKSIRRRLTPGGVLIATFDNRWAAIDHYLQRGSMEEMEEFLRTGRTQWLTRQHQERFPVWTCSPGQLKNTLQRCGFEVVDLVGKTVLPMRHYRELLDTPERRRGWARLEKSLWRDPAAIGRAAHLQVVARTGRSGEECEGLGDFPLMDAPPEGEV